MGARNATDETAVYRSDPDGGPDANKKGFTLVEVMVALAIMGMIMTVAFSGLSIGLDSWERGSREIDNLDRRATVERLLKRQLALASATEFKAGERTFTLFRGSDKRLEFISDYSLADGPADFRKIDYAVEDGRFLYGEKPLFGYVPAQNEEIPEALAIFRQVSFRFLGRDSQEAPVWVNEWKTDMGLPFAVQVQIDEDTFVIRLVNR